LLYPALFSAFNIYLFFGFFFFVAFNLFYLAQLSLSLASSYPYQYAKVRSGRKGEEMGGMGAGVGVACWKLLARRGS